MLIRGYKRSKVWVGTAVVQIMARAWLLDGLNNGCSSWDVHIQRVLGVVLQSCLDSRVGQSARSTSYTGNVALCWKDIRFEVRKRVYCGLDDSYCDSKVR